MKVSKLKKRNNMRLKSYFKNPHFYSLRAALKESQNARRKAKRHGTYEAEIVNNEGVFDLQAIRCSKDKSLLWWVVL